MELDIEMSNTVVLARSGEAPVEHCSSRRRLLMMGKDMMSSQNKGSVRKRRCEPHQSSGGIGPSVM